MNDIVFAGQERPSGEHEHRGWEVFLAASRGQVVAEGEPLFHAAGDIVIVPRRCVHTHGAGGESVVIENALLPACRPCVLASGDAADLSWGVQRAVYYFSAVLPQAKKIAVLGGLGSLIVSLIGAYCGGNDFSPTVELLLGAIEKGLSDTAFSLENTISSLPLNYDYVRKLFGREVGLTPLAYLTERRMSLAREIMLSGMSNRYSNLTVSQVAEMCGYADPLYFSRVFKKRYGVSPAGYLRRNGG